MTQSWRRAITTPMSDDLAFPGMEPATPAPAYRVLARKYRPASFDTLLGQDAMVQTLANAIARDRLAQVLPRPPRDEPARFQKKPKGVAAGGFPVGCVGEVVHASDPNVCQIGGDWRAFSPACKRCRGAVPRV